MTEENHKESIWRRFKSLFGGKQQETVRETIEDLIEEANSEGDCPFSEHEQLLLNNILYLKDKKCCPRHDSPGPTLSPFIKTERFANLPN